MSISWVNDYLLDPTDPVDAQEWHALLRRSRIPRRYYGCKPELVKGEKGRKWVESAIAHPEKWAGKGWGYYVHGPFNCGKSAAAACLALDMLRRCHAVEWMTVRDVPGIVFRDTPEQADRYSRLPHLDLLVLDDLGSHRFNLTSAAGTALEDVVRIMFDNNRPVVYTGNVEWDKLSTMFGQVPAFVSVVERTSIPMMLNTPWDDMPGVSHGS